MKKLVFFLLLSMGAFYLNAQNNCLTFDGSDDYVNCGTLPALRPTSAITVEAWININSIGQWEGVVSNLQDNGSEESGYAFYFNNENITWWLKTVNGSTNFENNAPNASISTGSWNHIAGTYDGSALRLYVNGIFIDDYATTGNIDWTYSPLGFFVGSLKDNDENYYFDGKIDEVRIWNTARTETEIRQNMYRELPDPDSELTLVAYYKLNETGSTTSAADSKGSNNGTLTNMAGSEWQTSPAFFGPKNCLNFNASDDYVSGNLTSSASSVLTIEFSVSFNDLSNQQNLLYISDGATNQRIVPYKDADNKINLFVADVNNNADVLSSDFIIEQNKWYHLAFVYDDKAAAIYVNGLNVASKTMTYSYALDGSDIFSFGSDNGGGSNSNVKMDEVRIWNTARTETEICGNMFTSLNGNESGLIAYYNFDNVINGALADFSGKNNDGALYNMSATNLDASAAFNTWLNTNSTNWSLAGNWSRGSVPTSTDHVGVHEQDGDDPDISSDIECHNLTIGLDATLDFQSGSHTIHGSVFNIGITNINNGTDLTVTGSVYMLHHSHINIKPLAELTIDKDLHTEIWGLKGYLTIESDNNGTGSLIVGGSSSGKLTTQRYITDTKWHYVSAPVSGQDITSDWITNNSIITSPDYRFYRFDEPTNYWIIYGSNGNPASFGDLTFVDARGYCLSRNGNGTLSFEGSLRTDATTMYAATYNPETGNGFNLIGNPYTCSVGITNAAASTKNFLAENTDLLDNSYEAIYIWDEQSDWVNRRNDYKVISNTGIPAVLIQDFIQPGQAFMVKVASAGDIVFSKEMQSHQSENYYKNNREIWPSIELIAKNEALYNSTAFGFNENMTLGLDPSFDVGKMKGNPDIALYSRLIEDNGIDFAIQALPTEIMDNSIIPIGIDVAETAEIHFSINQNGMDKTNIRLEDRKNGIFIDLKSNEYSTLVSESGTGRFFLHIGNTTAVEEINGNAVQAYVAGGIIIIQSEQQPQRLILSDIAGRTLGVWESTESIPVPSTTGVYLVTVETDHNRITKKIIVE